MKTYIVRHKDTKDEILCTKAELEAIEVFLTHLSEGGINPFDYELVEEDVNSEYPQNYHEAMKVLGFDIDDVPNRIAKTSHGKAIFALEQLFTIAEAWNKIDEFVPDLDDEKQEKWFPYFKWNTEKRFVYIDASCINENNYSPSLGVHFCFATEERADQFGWQFEKLFNEAFT